MRKIRVGRRWEIQEFSDPIQAIRAGLASSDRRASDDSATLNGHFVVSLRATLQRFEFRLDDGRVFAVWSDRDDVEWSITPGSGASASHFDDHSCWPINIQRGRSIHIFNPCELLAPHLKYPLLWVWKGAHYFNIHFIGGGAVMLHALWNYTDNCPFLGVGELEPIP